MISGNNDTSLSTLACQAAIELDNYINNQSTEGHALAKLAARISGSIIQSDAAEPPMNPSAVVVMKCAIQDSNWSNERMTNLQDLIGQARKITDRLSFLAAHRNDAATGDVSKLRLFCLTLSKLSLAAERARAQTRPDHPFRR